MLKNYKKIKNTITSVILLLLILYIAFSNGYYKHSHVLSDGSVVTHSHPYNTDDKSPYKTHHHSKTEYILLLNAKKFITGIITVLIFFKIWNIPFYVISEQTIPLSESLLQIFKRAPPEIFKI